MTPDHSPTPPSGVVLATFAFGQGGAFFASEAVQAPPRFRFLSLLLLEALGHELQLVVVTCIGARYTPTNPKRTPAASSEPKTTKAPIRACALTRASTGGRYRHRSCDLLGVNEALYHLS